MDCGLVQQKLSDYLEKSLTGVESHAVATHLSMCTVCSAEMHSLTRTIENIRRIPEVDPPPGFSEKIMAKVREEAAVPSWRERIFFPLHAKLPIHAAAILLIGGLAAYLYTAIGPLATETRDVPPRQMETARRKDAPAGEKKESSDRRSNTAVKEQTSLEDRAPLPEPIDSTFADSKAVAPEAVAKQGRSTYESTAAESESRAAGGVAPLASKPEAPAEAVSTVLIELRVGPDASPEQSAAIADQIAQWVNRSGGRILDQDRNADAFRDDASPGRRLLRIALPKNRYAGLRRELSVFGNIVPNVQNLSDEQSITLTLLPPEIPTISSE